MADIETFDLTASDMQLINTALNVYRDRIKDTPPPKHQGMRERYILRVREDLIDIYRLLKLFPNPIDELIPAWITSHREELS